MDSSSNGNGNGYHKDEAQTLLLDSPFQLVPAKEMDKLPEIEWLLPQLIPKDSLTVLFGASGAGKSFIAIDMALTIAQEQPVFYVAAESFRGYATRQKAWATHHQKDYGQLYYLGSPVMLMDNENVDQFIDTTNTIKPALIVLDTLAWCMTGGDENSSKDMQIVIANCRRIQEETGATILLVHHTTKRGGAERGSSALRGGADMMIELVNRDGTLELSCSKSKDSEPFKKKAYKLMKVKTDRGESCVVMHADMIVDTSDELSERQVAILEILDLSVFGDIGASAIDISNATEIPRSTIHRYLSKLKDLALIRQHKSGDPYYITDKGKATLKRN